MTDHTQDSDCTIDPETNGCIECGVYHGVPCDECGSTGFHLDACSTLDEEEGKP